MISIDRIYRKRVPLASSSEGNISGLANICITLSRQL